MKTAIVTGASGFIGSVLCNMLCNCNYNVIGLSRTSKSDLSKEKKELLLSTNYLSLDLSNTRDLEKVIRQLKKIYCQIDYIFHLAWGGNNTLSDENIDMQYKNVILTQNLFNIAKQFKIRRFIFSGTMEEAFAKEYTKLDYNINTQFNRHVIYALAKTSARNALISDYSPGETELVFASNSHVIGPNDDKDSFLQVLITKILLNQEITMSSGEQNFDVINVKDCARAYISIAEKGMIGSSYWIGSGKPRKLIKYVERIKKLYPPTKPIKVGKLPYNDMKLPLETFDIDNLVTDTGFTPKIKFDDSIKELADHIKSKRF